MDRGRDGMMEGNGERDGGRDELREVDLSTVDVLFVCCCCFSRATDQQYGIRTKKSYLKTTQSCMDTPMNMYSSKEHIKRLTGAFFLADIQTMTYTQVHGYLGHASMFLLTLH